MNKEIHLNTEQYSSFILIIKNLPDTGELEMKINAKTYGGLITLKGTMNEIELFCSFLEDNNIPTDS